MKTLMFRYVFDTSIIVILFSVLLVTVNCEINKDGFVSTTEMDPLLKSLNNIVTKVEGIKSRLRQTLNETATLNLKSNHDLLVTRGYQPTLGIGYHKLHLIKLNWFDALNFCRKENAHLAVIDSVEEQIALGEKLKKTLPDATGEDTVAYVGLYDDCEDRSWIDVFFNKAKHIRWYESNPLYSANHIAPSCAAVDLNGYLINLYCTSKRAFFCEAEL